MQVLQGMSEHIRVFHFASLGCLPPPQTAATDDALGSAAALTRKQSSKAAALVRTSSNPAQIASATDSAGDSKSSPTAAGTAPLAPVESKRAVSASPASLGPAFALPAELQSILQVHLLKTLGAKFVDILLRCTLFRYTCSQSVICALPTNSNEAVHNDLALDGELSVTAAPKPTQAERKMQRSKSKDKDKDRAAVSSAADKLSQDGTLVMRFDVVMNPGSVQR